MNPRAALAAAFAALGLAGCSGFGMSGESHPQAAAAAPPLPPAAAAPVQTVVAALLPTPAEAAPTAPAQPIPSGAALGGVLGGPIGASLSEADREAAWTAQIAALDSGQRRSWRGPGGVFGFVEPGAETGAGCRAYVQTIYIAGRPKRGQGVACKQPDETWRVTS